MDIMNTLKNFFSHSFKFKFDNKKKIFIKSFQVKIFNKNLEWRKFDFQNFFRFKIVKNYIIYIINIFIEKTFLNLK
jgi:hypothetical protein